MKRFGAAVMFLLVAVLVAWAANVKISAFPDASTNMAGADRITGLHSGVNVNFSQSQIIAGSYQFISSGNIVNVANIDITLPTGFMTYKLILTGFQVDA